MTRPTMDVLIYRMQAVLPASPELTGDAIQTELDRHREDVYRLALTPVHTTLAGGIIVYRDYYAQAPGGIPLADWETGSVLQSGTWADVTADATADDLTGHWTFAADHRPPLYLSGRTYDFWGAAAALVRQQAATFVRQVNFATAQQRVDLSDQSTHLYDLARQYDRMRRRLSRQLTRSDTPAWAP